MNVKIKKLKASAYMPEYGTENAACADIRSTGNYTIFPGETVMISTGIAAEIEDRDYCIHIHPRSGLSCKHGITLANCTGVVDWDYRGEIMVGLHNISENAYRVSAGDKIAQMEIVPVVRGIFMEADELSDTSRGEGGFGSTGK